MSLILKPSPPGDAGPRPAGPSAPRRIAASAIGDDRVAGPAGRVIDAEGAYALGLACAGHAQDASLMKLAVCRDGARGSAEFEGAVVQGLSDGGLSVARIGLGPTPMLAYAVGRLGLDGGVMVYGSHEPVSEAGFAIFLGATRVRGEALRALAMAPLCRIRPGPVERRPVIETYAACLASAAVGMPPLAVVWDCGGGAASPLVERLIGRLPGFHSILNVQRGAGGVDVGRLIEVVTDSGGDFGIAFDDAGERGRIFDDTGQAFGPDDLGGAGDPFLDVLGVLRAMGPPSAGRPGFPGARRA